ncbi:MAG: hypothetical protein LQ345_004672 [Seirophora villosa]|nr:MAG: hypothetical protein LQ345_004672 [Seirophora villosa]
MQRNDGHPDAAKAGLLRSPLPTPRWGGQGGPAFTVRAVTSIKAASSTVLRTLLDTSMYPDWNRFVPRVTFSDVSDAGADATHSKTQLARGVTFIEHVDMSGNGKPSGLVKMKLLMTALEKLESNSMEKTDYKVVWLGKGYPDWALRSERVHAILSNTDGTTTYDVFETFSGPLALLVRLFVGPTLVRRFKQWNEELAQYAEKESQDRHVSASSDLGT